jgi:hypothetical protein
MTEPEQSGSERWMRNVAAAIVLMATATVCFIAVYVTIHLVG